MSRAFILAAPRARPDSVLKAKSRAATARLLMGFTTFLLAYHRAKATMRMVVPRSWEMILVTKMYRSAMTPSMAISTPT